MSEDIPDFRDVVFTADGVFKPCFIATPYGVRRMEFVDGKWRIEWLDGDEPLEFTLR